MGAAYSGSTHSSAGAMTWSRSKACLLKSSASFSTAGVGPASQGHPLWPNAIPCPLRALSLCSPPPTRSQNVAKTQANNWQAWGGGSPSETPPLRLSAGDGCGSPAILRRVNSSAVGFGLAQGRHSIPTFSCVCP